MEFEEFEELDELEETVEKKAEEKVEKPPEKKKKSSQAKIDANARYDKKAYDNVLVKFRKDAPLTLATVKEHAAAHGESTNGFIVRVITEAIEREKAQTDEAKTETEE